MSDERMGPGTYLTEAEAKEFHKLFITSFLAFTIVAVIAHVLVYSWRPWIPGPHGYAEIETGVKLAMASVTGLFA